MNEPPQVSIIIPTRNRQHSLEETLLSADCLDYPRNKYEVVVIDDHSSDRTRAILAELKSSLSYPLRYDRLKEKKGISAARNLGMQMAKGRFFVFTDDDCLFQKYWLTSLLEPFRSTQVGAVGGLDYAPEDATLFSKCVGYLFSSFIGTGGLRGGNMFKLGKYYPKGCNMAVRKEAIGKAGLFDELLGPGEEIELGYRIEKAGYQIRFAPKAFVWHKRRITLKAFLKKMFKIGYTRVVLARRHRGLLQIGHMVPFIGVMMVFSLLTLSLISSTALKILLLITSGYLLILLASGFQAFFRIKDLRAWFIVPSLLFLHHSTHGIGFFVAVIKHFLGFKNIYLPRS